MSNLNLITSEPAESWCAECAAEANWVTLEEATSISGASARTIGRWVEAGRVHLMESEDGVRRVCLNSPLL